MVSWSWFLCCEICGFDLVVQAFELITGDYLFEPHSGQNYSRDEGKLTYTEIGYCGRDKIQVFPFIYFFIFLFCYCFLLLLLFFVLFVVVVVFCCF